MRKFVIISLVVLFFSISLPVYADSGFFKPNSQLYFLQPMVESIKLFFTFSKEDKTDYLLQLTERRVDEMTADPSAASASRYQKHFEQLEELASEIREKEQVIEKIKEASLRQQEVLADVYTKVPDEAKDAILNAQENSSKNVANVIETVQGIEKAQEYIQRVEQIQRVEKVERDERLEQVPMEGAPNADPSESIPRELNENKGLLPGKELNSQNPIFDAQGSNSGKEIEPTAPIEKQQPVPQQ